MLPLAHGGPARRPLGGDLPRRVSKFPSLLITVQNSVYFQAPSHECVIARVEVP